MVFVEMTLRLPSCEPQAPTVDLKVTFLNPAKQRAGAQVRREREGRTAGETRSRTPAGERRPEKGLWEERVWFEEADQGMLPHPGTGNSGEPSALPPKGQRDGREWALDSGLQTELQRMVASPEHSVE